jgi:hypothetical protein
MGFSVEIHSGKPLNHLYFTNPFTKVSSLPRLTGGNTYINSNSVGYLLPSALADGFKSYCWSWL